VLIILAILLTAIATAAITFVGALVFGNFAMLQENTEEIADQLAQVVDSIALLDRKIESWAEDAEEEEVIEYQHPRFMFSPVQMVQVLEVLQAMPDDRKPAPLQYFEMQLTAIVEKLGLD